MAKTKKQSRLRRTSTPATFDGVYLFKMVLYLLVGSLWFKISNGQAIQVGIPVGLVIGLIFSAHEHFQIDRKIEYAVLLVSMLMGYFAPYGLYLNF